MATKERAPKPNREQRRAKEFGSKPAPDVASPWSADDVPANEAIAGRPDQDQTRMTGAGAGGATEHDGRMPRHEGTHATNSAKG